MFGNAWIIFLQVLPLFLMMGVRFVLGKCGMLTRTGTAELSRILLYVVTPCLIVDSFQMELDRETLRLVAVGCGALALCYVAYILLSRFFPCPSSVYSDSFALRLHLWKWYLYWHSLVEAVIGPEGVLFTVRYCLLSSVTFFAGPTGSY